MTLSKNEQDYLKGIYMLSEKDEYIPVKNIADHLEISVPSVNEMIKRLEKKELLKHYAYKGIKLTETGEKEALFIVKAHRLWEYFLVNKLGFQLDDVHDDAELLEHTATKKLVERLYKFLEQPKICPHGSVIPDYIFWEDDFELFELSDVKIGMIGELILKNENAEKYLEELEIKNIKWVEVIKRISVDGTLILRTESSENNLVLSPSIQKDFQLKIFIS